MLRTARLSDCSSKGVATRPSTEGFSKFVGSCWDCYSSDVALGFPTIVPSDDHCPPLSAVQTVDTEILHDLIL